MRNSIGNKMHTKILRYLFCNGSIYLGCFMFFKLLTSGPTPVEHYVWHISVYPVILLPMIFFNVLYLSGFLGNVIDSMENDR